MTIFPKEPQSRSNHSGTGKTVCQRYTAICKQNPIKSGENDEVGYDQQILLLYNQQVQNNFGYPKKFDRFLKAHKFLKLQPTWNDNSTSADEENNQGKKKTAVPLSETNLNLTAKSGRRRSLSLRNAVQ